MRKYKTEAVAIFTVLLLLCIPGCSDDTEVKKTVRNNIIEIPVGVSK